MKFIHYIDKTLSDSIKRNGIKVEDCYRGNGILIYPEKDIRIKSNSNNSDILSEEKKLNDSLSIIDKWELIGALKLKQSKRNISKVIFELNESHWPLKVFIDIHETIAIKFAKLLEQQKSGGIHFASESTLIDVIEKVEFPKYVLEGVFIVKTLDALTLLMDKFQEAGGGIWGAHSFDCMIESNINPDLILDIN